MTKEPTKDTTTDQPDLDKSYTPKEAIDLAQKLSKEKFDASLEVHFKLGIDTKQGDQQVRGTVDLPHGTGKTKKIAAFVDEANEQAAKDAGADLMGGEEFIKKIKETGKIEFDVAVAVPPMMPKLAQIAKILGPRGLMPSPKNETVTPKIKETIEKLKKGKVAFKNDDTANIHQIIGKKSFTAEQLTENLNTLLAAIKKAKPASSKGTYIENANLCTSMGPSIKLAV